MNSNWDDNKLGEEGFAPASGFNTAMNEAERGEDIETFTKKRVLDQLQTSLATTLAGSGHSVDYFSQGGSPLEIWDDRSDAESPLITIDYDHNEGNGMLTVLDQEMDCKQINYDGANSRDVAVSHVAGKLGVEVPETSVVMDNTAG